MGPKIQFPKKIVSDNFFQSQNNISYWIKPKSHQQFLDPIFQK